MDLNGDVYCQICQGRGDVIQNLELLDMCVKCNGHGRRDWVDHARNEWGKADLYRYRNTIMRNISILTRELHNQYNKLDLEVQIEITERRRPSVYPSSFNTDFLKL